MEKQLKSRYGSFALAAAAYAAGVLIFSAWSYTAHRGELLGFMDKSLLDTAFSVREIVAPEMNCCLHPENPEALTEQLRRTAQRGQFAGIGTAVIRDAHTDLLFAGPEAENAGNGLAYPELEHSLEQELIKLAGNCRDDALLFTLKCPRQGPIRAAAVFTAGKEPGNGAVYLALQHSSVIEQELADQMLRLTAAGAGLLILAVPLIILFSRSQKETASNLAEMNEHLQHDMELQKSREQELKDAISDLERFSSVAAGRESRIIELKSEVNELLEELSRDKRYNIDKID